jgi:hypothetical protein
MEDHPAERQSSTPRDGDSGGWVPAGSVESLRALVGRHLAGEQVGADVRRLAADLARAARRSGESAERLLIVIRGLWRDLGLSQSDRLQVASLYERLVRQAIEEYYDDA